MNRGEIFLPSVPLLEIVLRGSITYLGLFALLRFVLKREAEAVGITDLLFIVLVAGAAQTHDHRLGLYYRLAELPLSLLSPLAAPFALAVDRRLAAGP